MSNVTVHSLPQTVSKTQDSNFFHNCIFPPQVLTILHGIFVAPPTWWHSSLKNVCNLHPPDMIFSEPLRAAASRGSTSKKESGLASGAGFCEIQKLKKKYRVKKKKLSLDSCQNIRRRLFVKGACQLVCRTLAGKKNEISQAQRSRLFLAVKKSKMSRFWPQWG